MKTMAILNDTTLCTGCEQCVDACKQSNALGKDLPRRWKKRIDDLSSTRYTTLIRRPENRFVRLQCRHCLEPACVSACLVGAMQKTPQGAVIYDSGKCMGCRYCMMACPYGIPRYDWEKAVPWVRKCNLCYERLQEGKKPVCVGACPQGATLFGTRESLLAEAHSRIRNNPGKYVNKVVGETEIGGTSVLYLSDISLDFLAFKSDLGDTPLPRLSWAALSKVPPLALGVGSVMAGVWWVIGRRMKLAAEKDTAQKKLDPKTRSNDLDSNDLEN
jgi:formate dehydrogenase iron-sulfur subunit